MNRSATRRDLPFLRRRVRPVPEGETAGAVPDDAGATSASGAAGAPAHLDLEHHRPSGAGAGTGGTGLDLGQRNAGAPAPAGSQNVATTQSAPRASTRPRRSPPVLPFPAPGITQVRELGDDEPVVRLNARESAIGSLIVSGTSAVVWESSELITGAAAADGSGDGTPVTTTGNRSLVGYDGGDALVALRHLHSLRRALFIGGGPGTFGVQLFDGSSFTVSTGDGNRMFVLSLLRIGNLVELRAEPVSRSEAIASIHRLFGFQMTPHLTAREPRRR